MNTTLKFAAVAAALVASTASHAALKDFATLNSSLVFFAVDKTDMTSVTVDLSYLLNDTTSAAFTTPGTTIQWNFNSNSLLVNGAAKPGTYNWSTPFSFFSGAAVTGNTLWGVIAGTTGSYPDYYVTTGNPNASQLLTQATSGNMPNMGALDAMYKTANNNIVNTSTRSTTQKLPGFGANSVVGENTAASGYVGAGANMGSNLNWGTNLSWTAGVAVGGTTPLWAMDDDTNNIFKVSSAAGTAGSFTYSAGVLTWSIPSAVPEPGTYALFGAGLGVIALRRRRRA